MRNAADEEQARINALRALNILDTPREERFERITRLVKLHFNVPIAVITLVDEERVWFKSCLGLDATESPRSISFCDHAIRQDEIFIVEDAHTDPRFAGNPLVVNQPSIRFYAGQPLRTLDGHMLGFLCIIDRVPRVLTPSECLALRDFSVWLEQELNMGQILANHSAALQATNMNLMAQAEELTAQQEEVTAVNEELREQTDQLLLLSRDLAHQRRFAETLLERLPAGVAYIDPQFVFRVVNPVLAKFYGRPPDELVGRTVFSVLPGSQQGSEALYASVRDNLEPVFLESLPVHFEQDGQPKASHWDATILPYLDAEGRFNGWLVLAQEVSERVAAEAHKDQFLGILSHELRTPLNAIMGFGSVLEDGLMGELSPEQAAYLGKILSASDTMLSMVDDLLDMSRVQAGKFTLASEPLELADMVSQTLENFTAAARSKQLNVVNDVPIQLTPVMADAQRIGQVLSNLVGNAVKYTPVGGNVVVRVGDAEGGVRVEVADTGVGIASEHQARIFQPFTQVDMSNTRAAGGVGLGLSIVRALVEAHGGEVGVDSKPGAGSTFWFTLPAAQPISARR